MTTPNQPLAASGSEQILITAIVPNLDSTQYLLRDGELPFRVHEQRTSEYTFNLLGRELAGLAISVDHLRGSNTAEGVVIYGLAKAINQQKATLGEGVEWCSPERAAEIAAFVRNFFKLVSPENESK